MSIDQRNITATLRQMSDPALQQFAQMNQENPYLFPLAFQESQDRKMLRSQTQAQGAQQPPVKEQALMAMAAPPAPQQGQMPQGAPMPPTQMAANGGYMSSQLPEDVGIGALPVRGMNFAEGGIVAFAGGGYNEAGDAGRLEILEQEMRAAQQRLSRGDTRAQGDIDSLTREIGRIKNPGASIAKKITSALPLGSAQAAPIQAAPIQAAQPAAAAPAQAAPSIYSGEGYTPEGLEALGQRLDVIREARGRAKPAGMRERQADPGAAQRFEALQNLNTQSQQEYEQYAEKLGLNKPAFAAQAAGGKGVGTTTIPQVQAVAREAAAPDIARQEAAGMEPAPPMAQEEFRKLERVPSEPLAPAKKKEVIDLAKSAVPPEERKSTGFTGEDWLNMGLAMMAGESPYAMQNIGKAGVATLAARQTRAKTEADQRKAAQDIEASKALARYHTAAANRYALEDKPQMQYQKAIDNAIAKLSEDPEYKFAKTPAEKTQMEDAARARVRNSFLSVYPELADTMGGGEFKVLGSRASP